MNNDERTRQRLVKMEWQWADQDDRALESLVRVCVIQTGRLNLLVGMASVLCLRVWSPTTGARSVLYQ
jgi:hypothetical protein